MPSVIVRVGAGWFPHPDYPAIPTHNERDIHQDGGAVVFDFTIVNIALPSMERDFGVSTSVGQWVVTGYAIAFSGLLILGGRARPAASPRLASCPPGGSRVTGDALRG
jgi:hypothetical protein